MVVDDDGRGIAGDHFRSAAYELLVGLILHALYKAEKVGRLPGLYDCAHMLTGVGDFAAPDTENDLADDPEGDPRASGLTRRDRAARPCNPHCRTGAAATACPKPAHRMTGSDT